VKHRVPLHKVAPIDHIIQVTLIRPVAIIVIVIARSIRTDRLRPGCNPNLDNTRHLDVIHFKITALIPGAHPMPQRVNDLEAIGDAFTAGAGQMEKPAVLEHNAVGIVGPIHHDLTTEVDERNRLFGCPLEVF
jgi:hypothetical protein